MRPDMDLLFVLLTLALFGLCASYLKGMDQL